MLKQYFLNQNKRLKYISLVLVILIVAGIGTYLLTGSHAATPYASSAADKGTTTSPASVVQDSTASDGNAVRFGSCANGNNVSFTPTIIPLSAAEIPNDMRGQYLWNGSPGQPFGWPTPDVYYRDEIHWNQIETSPGVYNFSIFDQGLSKAQAQGGKFGFRITAFNPGFGNDLPSWTPLDPNNTDGLGSEKMPEWNNTSPQGFLADYTQMMSALANHMTSLGVKFADDPRLGFIDMGGYGNNGEWHIYMQNGGTPITEANMDTLMKDEMNDFPHKILLAQAVYPNQQFLADAMTFSAQMGIKVGVRFDNLGTSDPGNGNIIAQVPSALTEWMTAPIVTEWSGGTPSNEFSTGLSQVNKYHISLLSSDNYPSPAADPANLALADKTSGYRYQLDKASLPSQLTPGGSFSLSSNWENVNVAPTYEPWNVQFELRNASGQVGWTGTSSLNLDKLLPTNGTPDQVTDLFTIPSSVTAGTYTLAISVVDPSNYLAPMNLADQGRTSNGAYPLGSVTVH